MEPRMGIMRTKWIPKTESKSGEKKSKSACSFSFLLNMSGKYYYRWWFYGRNFSFLCTGYKYINYPNVRKLCEREKWPVRTQWRPLKRIKREKKNFEKRTK